MTFHPTPITECPGAPVRSVYYCEECERELLVPWCRRCKTRGNEWSGVVDVDKDGKRLKPVKDPAK